MQNLAEHCYEVRLCLADVYGESPKIIDKIGVKSVIGNRIITSIT